MPEFTGYTPGTLKFLGELERNNNREWFADNKDRYEALVREPSLDFIATMGPRIARLSTRFVALPKKTGGSLMRVYRDTRFSRDKTPYKTNIGIQFRHEVGKDVHAPGYYLHIDGSGCFLAAGVWHPDSAALRKIRERIAERPDAWRKAVSGAAFKRDFRLDGASLKRPPRGFDDTSPHLEDLKRKDFVASTNVAAAEIRSAKFVNRVAAAYRLTTPLMAFLCAALELEF